VIAYRLRTLKMTESILISKRSLKKESHFHSV
jgi:hypothetical protein